MVVSTIHRAKTNLSALIEKAEKGEEVIIARGKQPVVKLVPVKQAPRKRVSGMLRGAFEVGPAFFEHLPPEELSRWE